VRVLTIVSDLGPGGTQRVAQNYTLGYQMRGHPAAVLTTTAGGPRMKALVAHDIPVFAGGASWRLVEQAVDRAVDWRPDVIHIHRTGRPDARAAAILRRLRAARVGHDAVLETNVFGKVDYSKDRFLIDVHMPLTRWSLWKWRRWTSGLRPRPIGVVMPYLVDTSAFSPISDVARACYREMFGIPREAFVFGRVGQPIKPKWSPIIFSSFAEVATRDPESYLLLAGLPPELHRDMRSLPASVQSRVVEVPFMYSDAELRTCYGAMDVFLHASAIGESFGLVLAEAMLCERPIITLCTPANDNSQLEVVDHERGGLVVNDQTSMVDAMKRLLGDRPLRERLGRHGAASVRDRYDLESGIDQLLKIAHTALRATTASQLRADLATDPDLTTDVETAEIEAILARSLGRLPVKDRLLMDAVHIGWLYRLYSRFAPLLGKT
jgi:glycosyltransferase involved in cell wall biosynthesis